VSLQKYTEEQINKAAEMREDGKTYPQIAEALGMSHGAVYWHCLSLGAISPKAPPKRSVGPLVVKRGNHVVRRFTPEEDETLLKLEAEGKTLTEMSRAIDRRTNSVKGRLLTLGRIEERKLAG